MYVCVFYLIYFIFISIKVHPRLKMYTKNIWFKDRVKFPSINLNCWLYSLLIIRSRDKKPLPVIGSMRDWKYEKGSGREEVWCITDVHVCPKGNETIPKRHDFCILPKCIKNIYISVTLTENYRWRKNWYCEWRNN